MEIKLIFDPLLRDELIEGILLLSEDLSLKINNSGYPIKVCKRKGPLEVINKNGEGIINFQDKIEFFRGMGLWIENYKSNYEFNITEKSKFKTSGVMADSSRNAVLNKNEIESFLRKMSIMGLNVFMLYIEDIYRLPNYSYFGYMRGAYTEEELRMFDDYAHKLGIEIIPCIQTLAHLETTLKWNYANNMKDTEDILLVGEPETYAFIEEMIKSATSPFRTNRVHIGMDEAMNLGLGKYLEEYGYNDRFEIMNEHLQRVVSITESMGLEVMIWSDMFFRLGSKHKEYYDENINIPKEVISQIPSSIQLVYWDYYHSEEAFYQKYFQKHKELGSLPVFAGGAWTWNGLAPNYGRAFVNSEAALKAAKKENIEEVILTLWGDNGTETPLNTALPVMQLYAEHTYNDDVKKSKLTERFEFCTGIRLDDILLLNQFDETPGVSKNNLGSSSPSKFLLWQDILLGMFDKNIEGLSLNAHYEDLNRKLFNIENNYPQYSLLFSFYSQLAKVLSRKSEIGINLKSSYDKNDKKQLSVLLQDLQLIKDDVALLRVKHQELWFDCHKANGWEVLDIRYGGLIARMTTAQTRLELFVDNKIDQLEELEEERLPYDAKYTITEGFLGTEKYHNIVTAGHLSL